VSDDEQSGFWPEKPQIWEYTADAAYRAPPTFSIDIGCVQPQAAVSMNLSSWAAILVAVVALAQAPVQENGNVGARERDVDSFGRASQVRTKHCCQVVVRTSGPEFASLDPAAF
jgi:hypothetical protein